VQRGLDYDTLNNVENIELESMYFRDMEQMPLAPHRADYPLPEVHLWWFHRTVTNMSDFVQFVEYESTQVKADHDFYLGNDRNRSAKEGNLRSKEQWQNFVPGKSYGKSIVR
jgi:hypothetical protein